MIWPVTQTWRIPRNPEKTDTPTEMAVFGITFEGIKLERDTAGRVIATNGSGITRH